MQLLSPFMMHRPTPSCQREPEFSKRTSVYTGAGFAQVKYDDDGSDKTTQAYLGLTHRF